MTGGPYRERLNNGAVQRRWMRSCNATKTRAATATRSSGSARRARAKANGRPDSSLVDGVRVAGWPRRPGSARRPRASGGRLEPAFE